MYVGRPGVPGTRRLSCDESSFGRSFSALRLSRRLPSSPRPATPSRNRSTTRSGSSPSGTRTTRTPWFSGCCSAGDTSTSSPLIDADQGDLDEWNVRRMRLGPRVTLFRTFTLHGEVELNPQERDPFYVRFTDLYLQWSKKRAIRGDGRQARRPVHDGRGDVVQGAPHHRPQQLEQQHLVSAGVHSGRQRLGQDRAVGLSCRRVFGGRSEPRIRRVQRRRLHARRPRLRFCGVARREGGAADRQLRVSASGSAQHLHAAAGAHRLRQFQVRGGQVGRANRCFGRVGVPRPERSVGRDGHAVRQRHRQAPVRRPLHLPRQRRPEWSPARDL